MLYFRLECLLGQVDKNADLEGFEEETIANAMEHAFLAMLTGAMDPALFDGVYYADNPDERAGWRNGIAKEFSNMKKQGVWEKVKKKDIPEGANLLGCKWVFKKKKNGVYRARLIAKDYDQIPGVDYTENFAPMINNMTICTMLTEAQQNEDSIAYIVDVKTAFLYGEMDVELYMQVPEGIEHNEDIDPDEDCLQLKKTIYGTVQAARQWWKCFIKQLQDQMGFKQSRADPCLLFNKTEEGIVILCIYVDDAC